MVTVERLPERRAMSSPQSYGEERMKPSEAATYVKRMLSAYPEVSAGCSTEYLATLAETLCQFPRHVAVAACSPIHGVPKQFKQTKPTAGQVYEWCDSQAKPSAAELGRRAIEETRARYLAPPVDTGPRPPLDEILNKAARIMDCEVRDGHLKARAEIEVSKAEKARHAAQIDRANKALQREMIPIGMMDGKPLMGSRSLAKSLGKAA